jgi:cytoskeleton protein RodZ
MVAAVVVYFLPEGMWSPRGAASAPLAASVPASAASAAAEPASAASTATVGGEPVFPPPMAGTPPVVAAVEPVPPPVAAPAASTAPPQTVTAAPAGPVQLHAQQASWVEARDARGQLLLSRILQPGETLGLEGNLPIRLTIGNAAATQLAFRGQPVDLAASTRDNVARIELR